MEKNKFDELTKKAETLAFEYHQKYGGCSQSVLAALKDALCDGKISEDVVLAATGLAGGMARCGLACGAMTGGIMAISMYWGRPYSDLADPEKRRIRTFTLCKKLVDKFTDTYGSADCAGIQRKHCGRSFDFWNPKENEAFMATGHKECYKVSGNCARWVLEILNEEGLI